MEKNGLTANSGKTKRCTGCGARKALKAQAQLLDGFAKIFLWLHDQDRMGELDTLRQYVSAERKSPCDRLILAYSGKATANQDRLVVVSCYGV